MSLVASTAASVDKEVACHVFVEVLWGPLQSIQGLLEAPYLLLAFCCSGAETVREVDVHCFFDVCVEEGACDVQTIENRAFLCVEGQDEIDGLGVHRW